MFIMSKAIEWEKIDMRLLIDKLSRDQLRQTISDSLFLRQLFMQAKRAIQQEDHF